MSDPVTNVEIEDVLSSIRRLVSVDSARRSAPNTAPAVISEPQSPRKLVLTEAFRVGSETMPDEPEDVVADYTRSLERRIAELEAAVTAQASEFEPDGSEDTDQHRPTTLLFRPARSDDGAVELDILCQDDLDPAEDEPEVGEVHHGELQDEAAVEHSAMWSDHDPCSELDDQSDEEVVGVFQMKPEDRAAESRSGDAFQYPGEEALIDEETLRDMVSEIVRDELQGALGERITRNVRKLVRREIMRAISIRDFD